MASVFGVTFSILSFEKYYQTFSNCLQVFKSKFSSIWSQLLAKSKKLNTLGPTFLCNCCWFFKVPLGHVGGGGLGETMTEGYAGPRGGSPYVAHRPSEEYQGGSEGSLGVRVLVILRIQGMGKGAGGTGDLRSTLGCTGLRIFGGRVGGG